jgi:UDP-glucuronate decarboxylase
VRHPQHEDYWGNVNPIGPRACYDEGKRAAETLTFDFVRGSRVAASVARIFNTYGPRMREDDGRVVSNVVVQALSGRDVTIYGSGQQTRSFCYVDDMIEGLVRLERVAGRGDDHPGPVNLGNPVEVTVAEIVARVLGMTGSRSKIEHLPLPVDDPRRRRPDVRLAEKLLDWRPTVGLDAGLERTIAWFEGVGVSDRRVAGRTANQPGRSRRKEQRATAGPATAAATTIAAE